jgi:hypothetical protein
LNLAAVFPASAVSDLHLETQPSHGSVTWSDGVLAYTPATDYRGPDNFTVSTSKKALVNGQLVNAGRENQVWGIVVQ